MHARTQATGYSSTVIVTPHHAFPVSVTPSLRFAACQRLALPQSGPKFEMRCKLNGEGTASPIQHTVGCPNGYGLVQFVYAVQ